MDIPEIANAVVNTKTEAEQEFERLLALSAAVNSATAAKPSTASRIVTLRADKMGLAQRDPNSPPVYAVRLINTELGRPIQVIYTPKEEHMARFQMEDQTHSVTIETKRAEFEQDVEWVHTQAKGKWSVRIEIETKTRHDDVFFLNERENREHKVIYSFETMEDAALFKLFRA